MSSNPFKSLGVVSSLGLIGYITFVVLSIPSANHMLKGLLPQPTVEYKAMFSTESEIASEEYATASSDNEFLGHAASRTTTSLKGSRFSDIDKINTVKESYEKSVLQPSEQISDLNQKITEIRKALDQSIFQPKNEINDINSKVTSIKNSLDQAENYRKFKIIAAIMLNFVFGLYGLHFEISEENKNQKLGKVITTMLIFGNTLLGFI